MVLCSYSAYSVRSITSSNAKLLCLFNFLQIYLILHHHHKTSRRRSFYLWIFTSQRTAVCLLLPVLWKGTSESIIHREWPSTDSGASLQSSVAACALLRGGCHLLQGPLLPFTLLASSFPPLSQALLPLFFNGPWMWTQIFHFHSFCLSLELITSYLVHSKELSIFSHILFFF